MTSLTMTDAYYSIALPGTMFKTEISNWYQMIELCARKLGECCRTCSQKRRSYNHYRKCKITVVHIEISTLKEL